MQPSSTLDDTLPYADGNPCSNWAPEYPPEELKIFQQEDPDLAPILRWIQEDIEPTQAELRLHGRATRSLWLCRPCFLMFNDVLYYKFIDCPERQGLSLVVPSQLRAEVLKNCHETKTSGHLGQKKTLDKLKQAFLWMRKIHEFARNSLRTSQLRQERDYDLRVVEHEYQPGDLVYKADSTTKVGQSRKLKSPWCGPFLVVSSRHPLYTIRGRKGDSVVHHDKLKRCNDRDIPTWIKRLRHALFQAESEMDENWDDLDDTIPYSVDFNVQGMFESNEPTIESVVLTQSLRDPSYTHTLLTQGLEQGPQRDTVTALDGNNIDEPPNLDLGEISSSDKGLSGDIENAELSSTDDQTRPSAFPSSVHTSRMEEGSRSDQDVLSLCPHSEWHETRSDCTDLDVADLMVIDEVGPDDSDATAGASPWALGPAEGYSNMATGILPMSSSYQHHNEPESGETNEGKSEDCRAIVPSKSRLRKCPVCGLMSREKTRRHMMKTHMPWF
ncbi:unnamed protein product [Mytilus coruscus]|uniref:Integrase zinc-binding domain-containing protein n=1 Tax=Mytilus coruscus TaxID=42192 RepID=A0A6J8EVI8_MYTCO|nr:unnamed protein product [Mytilus coruscus]